MPECQCEDGKYFVCSEIIALLMSSKFDLYVYEQLRSEKQIKINFTIGKIKLNKLTAVIWGTNVLKRHYTSLPKKLLNYPLLCCPLEKTIEKTVHYRAHYASPR